MQKKGISVTFQDRLEAYKLLEELIVDTGATDETSKQKIVSYPLGWDDARVANKVGSHVSKAVVKKIRTESFGILKPRRSMGTTPAQLRIKELFNNVEEIVGVLDRMATELHLQMYRTNAMHQALLKFHPNDALRLSKAITSPEALKEMEELRCDVLQLQEELKNPNPSKEETND